jgi:hypothetical protein
VAHKDGKRPMSLTETGAIETFIAVPFSNVPSILNNVQILLEWKEPTKMAQNLWGGRTWLPNFSIKKGADPQRRLRRTSKS